VPLPIKLTRPNPVFISSLDANLKTDGMMGPSIPPPSQSGISIIGLRADVPPSEPTQPSVAAVAAEAKASAALLHQVHSPTQSSMLVAAVVEPDRSAAGGAVSAEAPRAPVVAENGTEEQAIPPSEKELDAAARALERSSEVIPRVPSVPPEAIGPLRGAAASLNPPSAPPPPDAPLASVSSQPIKAKDSVAAHIASLLGEPSDGLSEFPSMGSQSELENVVASVSARLGREFPQNDYMGPSAELRAATIAPIPERSEVVIEAKPEPIVEAKPEPVVEAKPEPVVEAKPEPVVEAKPEPVVEAKPEPVVEAKLEPVVEAKLEPVVEAKPEPVVEAKPEPVVAEEPAEVAPSPSSDRPAPPSIRLVFPRKNWEQGCAPRRAFRCALPVAESCSPAPRRVSVRPGPPEYAVGDSLPPGTLRGLG
jgi:hypothetical protein